MSAAIRMVPPKPWLDRTPRSVVLTFSPEDAAEILRDHNGRNRPRSPSHERRLADQLRRGLWQVNGETIIFGSDGQLLDGQTRLGACVLAGLPLSSYVVLGMDPEAFFTIGRGRRRSYAHDLAILGEKNTNSLAATLALVCLHDQGRLDDLGVVPDFKVGELLARHPDLRQSVSWVCTRKTSLLVEPRVASFCHYEFTLRDPVAAAVFFEDFLSGAGLAKGDPVLTLRTRLIREKASKSKLPALEALALVVKAWNHRRAGTTPRYLRWRTEGDVPESFPAIL